MITCPKCKKNSGDDWSQCEGSCPMRSSPHYDVTAKILSLYKEPFHYDGKFYIWDSCREMVADFDGNKFRVRGYGRMLSRFLEEDANELYDATEKFLLELVGDENDRRKVVEILNERWRVK